MTDENMASWDRANRPGCDADFARKLECKLKAALSENAALKAELRKKEELSEIGQKLSELVWENSIEGDDAYEVEDVLKSHYKERSMPAQLLDVDAICKQRDQAVQERDNIASRLVAYKKENDLLTHKIITCGIIAEGQEHRNTIYQSGGKWDSQQADMVRTARRELEEARKALMWVIENPDSHPYFNDGKWRIPYLVSGAGGFGGGVGEYTGDTLNKVIKTAIKHAALSTLQDKEKRT